MSRLWDTTFASRIHPDSELFEHVLEQSTKGTPVAVAAPALTEISFGFELKALDGDNRFASLRDWMVRLIASEVLDVVPLDGRAAMVAGRLRANYPHPPPERDRRSKSRRQAAWMFDIQIAAVAFTAGLDIATRNVRDFEELGASLERLYPDAPKLGVYSGFR